MYATWRLEIQRNRWFIVSSVIGLASVVGFLVARETITDKIGVTFVAATGVFYVLLQGKRAYWALLCIGVATITLGHHGIYTDNKTYLVPLEIILFALCAILLFAGITGGKPLDVKMPIALVFLTIWGVLHALATLVSEQDTFGDTVIAWVTTFVIGFPAFYVVGKIVKEEWQVTQILKIMMVVGAVMSVLGIIEYYFPSIAGLLPGLFTKASYVAQDGFVRAEFSFWGYPAAASVITWGMFIAFDQFSNATTLASSLITSAIIVVDGIAVFISGQRSSWIALPVGFVILNLNIKKRVVLITGAMLVIVIAILPSDFWNRMATLTSVVVKGQVVDTSTQSRLDRWQIGIDEILQNPLTGGGYTGGLVHDAVLEIGSHIGLIPAIVFVLFLIQLIMRIIRCLVLPMPDAKRYGLLFMALAVPWLIQMAIETDLQTPPFAAAQWVFLALAWFLPDIFRAQSTNNVSLEKGQT